MHASHGKITTNKVSFSRCILSLQEQSNIYRCGGEGSPSIQLGIQLQRRGEKRSGTRGLAGAIRGVICDNRGRSRNCFKASYQPSVPNHCYTYHCFGNAYLDNNFRRLDSVVIIRYGDNRSVDSGKWLSTITDRSKTQG